MEGYIGMALDRFDEWGHISHAISLCMFQILTDYDVWMLGKAFLFVTGFKLALLDLHIPTLPPI